MATTQGIASKWLRAEKGVTAIEFAIMAPLLVLMLALIVDAGIAIYEKQRLQQITREVAAVIMRASTLDEAQAIMDYSVEQMGNSLGGTPFVADPVVLKCLCPGEVSVPSNVIGGTECYRTCADGGPVGINFEISASLNYQTILPYNGISDSDLFLTSFLNVLVRE